MRPVSSSEVGFMPVVTALAVVLAMGCGNGTMDPDNRNPSASATADPTSIPFGDNHTTVVTLDGSGSSDPDGDVLTFAWTVPSGQFANGTTASDQIPQVTFPGSAPYQVTLLVDDGRGGQATAMVTIEVGPQNNPPTAVATASPSTVPRNDNNTTVVTLDGSGSSDPDGDALTYDWVPQSGTFVNNTSASSQIAQVTFPGNGDYTVTLTVDDGRGGSDAVSITVALGSE